jgi:transcriptional regulator with XRE-family HTH domain
MLIERLQRTFAERSRKNPQYSLRAFARSLGIDSSTLSAILRRKRPLTAKMAKKLIEQLDIDDTAESQMLLLGAIGAPESDGPRYTELALDVAEVLSSWEHFGILALLELDDFVADARGISHRLNIPIAIVLEALGRLEKLGLAQNRKGRWSLTGKNMATPSDIPSAVLRRGLRQNIERALTSLESDPVQVRDVTGITMAIDSAKLPEAKKLIRDFRRRLSAVLENGKKNSVYRLNIQLVPLTKEEAK